jgi:carboxyl-terminal processing protease
MANLKKAFFVFLILVFTGAIFASGVFFGFSNRPAIERAANLYNKEEGKPAEIDFSLFWKVWNIINEKYAEENGATDQEKVWGAIEGLVSSLNDPYSVFLPPQESEIFESDMKGEFQGVGMEIGMRQNILTVVAPLKGTPAERAGIKAGDKIIKIDGKETFGITIDEAVRLIRGKKGTAVVLTVAREGEEDLIDIEIVRDVIKIPVLETEKRENGIFVIKLYNFSGNSPNSFRLALREFIASGSDKLILDLRGNPGGFLEASIDIASWFLPVGKVVAREQFGDGREILYRSKGYDIFKELPFVILLNQGSASASEILAGALSEHGVATLVGEKTFGKGSVQEIISITPETSLKLTIARWLTPDGISISKGGLVPDIEVEMTKEDIEAGRDPQMEMAIDILLNP